MFSMLINLLLLLPPAGLLVCTRKSPEEEEDTYCVYFRSEKQHQRGMAPASYPARACLSLAVCEHQPTAYVKPHTTRPCGNAALLLACRLASLCVADLLTFPSSYPNAPAAHHPCQSSRCLYHPPAHICSSNVRTSYGSGHFRGEFLCLPNFCQLRQKHAARMHAVFLLQDIPRARMNHAFMAIGYGCRKGRNDFHSDPVGDQLCSIFVLHLRPVSSAAAERRLLADRLRVLAGQRCHYNYLAHEDTYGGSSCIIIAVSIAMGMALYLGGAVTGCCGTFGV
jgi:hypothetical protein